MAVDVTLSSFSFEMAYPGHAVQPDEPVFHIACQLNDDVMGDLGIRVIKIQEDDVVDEILDLLERHISKVAKAARIAQIKTRPLPRKAERQRLRAEREAQMPKPTNPPTGSAGGGGV